MLGEKNNQVDRIYRDLAIVFKSEDSLPIGTGKTGRLRQASFASLYNFAKKQYNVEVVDWKVVKKNDITNDKAIKDYGITSILESFLNKLDKGSMNPDEFIGAVRGIIAVQNINNLNGDDK